MSIFLTPQHIVSPESIASNTVSLSFVDFTTNGNVYLGPTSGSGAPADGFLKRILKTTSTGVVLILFGSQGFHLGHVGAYADFIYNSNNQEWIFIGTTG